MSKPKVAGVFGGFFADAAGTRDILTQPGYPQQIMVQHDKQGKEGHLVVE